MSDKESKERSSGDYRAVWRFKYNYMQPYGHCEANEVVTDGYNPASQSFDVIAVTPELAKAAWQKEHGWHAILPTMDEPERAEIRKRSGHFAYELVSGPEFVCYVDYEIKANRG